MTEGETRTSEKTGIESRETPTRRRVEIHIFRHGEGEHQKGSRLGRQETRLTPEGREQAGRAAEELFQYVKSSGGGIIAIRESPVFRTKETAFVFYETVRQLIDEQKEGTRVKLAEAFAREQLKASGAVPEMIALGYDDPVQAWLDNPDILPDKTPAIVGERLVELQRAAERLADRLSSEGVPIHYAWITHDAPYAAFLQRLTGRTPKELGGPLQNCEWAKLTLGTTDQENPRLTFRDQEFTLAKNVKKVP